VYRTLHPSPVGDLQLRADADGRLTGLYTRHDGAGGEGPFAAVRKQLDAYFAGELEAFDLPLAPHGTDFQLRVWNELVRIPFAVATRSRSSSPATASSEPTARWSATEVGSSASAGCWTTRRSPQAGSWRSAEPTVGHQVESNVPGRATGGISRTVGSVKTCAAVATGGRGVTVTVIGLSSPLVPIRPIGVPGVLAYGLADA
jgi:hypothetical protein